MHAPPYSGLFLRVFSGGLCGDQSGYVYDVGSNEINDSISMGCDVTVIIERFKKMYLFV